VVLAAEDPFQNVDTSYIGTVTLSSTDAQIANLPATYTFTPGDAGSHTFTGLILKTAGEQTITATDFGDSEHPGSSTVAVKAVVTKLVVTTLPPSPLVAGQPFVLAISAEDSFGNVDTSFNGAMTITLPGGGQTITVHAKDGVATFAGLTVGTAAQGGSIQATASGLPPVSTPPFTVQPAPPPRITAEQVLVLQKKNKKGKPAGKPVVQSITLDFSTAMNPTTAAKKKTLPAYNPIPFVASYIAATDSVTLTLSGKQTFAKGGEITVIYAPPNGVSDANDTPLISNDAKFKIAAKGTGITPG
jgi:hypothetical protein